MNNYIANETPYRSEPKLNTNDDMIKVDLRISKPDLAKVKKYLNKLNNHSQEKTKCITRQKTIT